MNFLEAQGQKQSRRHRGCLTSYATALSTMMSCSWTRQQATVLVMKNFRSNPGSAIAWASLMASSSTVVLVNRSSHACTLIQ